MHCMDDAQCGSPKRSARNSPRSSASKWTIRGCWPWMSPMCIVSPDGRHATCSTSLSSGTTNGNRRRPMAALEHARNYLRHELARPAQLAQQSRSCISTADRWTRTPTSRVEFLLKRAKKTAWSDRKISPKVKQSVVVLFLLALLPPRPRSSGCAGNAAPGVERRRHGLHLLDRGVRYDRVQDGSGGGSGVRRGAAAGRSAFQLQACERVEPR